MATLATAIEVTKKELELVQELMLIRGRTPELVRDELNVLARLADLHVQAGEKQ